MFEIQATARQAVAPIPGKSAVDLRPGGHVLMFAAWMCHSPRMPDSAEVSQNGS
ncbi:hypothetical protein [Streptomyces sp. NPDC048272]|uniref:hypothetical protein n=1 Tax=Streptomyces sp. NPDC048272 TaxID=3154616 RepID=UPI00343BA82F